MAALEAEEKKENRIPRPQGDQGRQEGSRLSPGEGTQASHAGLTKVMSTRLPGAEYRKVFDGGRPLHGRLLVAWKSAIGNADRQAGVVVSKKTFHDAVDRNRAKRLMRESYRLLAGSGEAPESLSWVFAAKKGIAGKECPEVMEDMKCIFSRALARKR